MTARTTLRFNSTADVWAIVEQWAVENAYRRMTPEGNVRSYEKGDGLLVAPMMLKVWHENQDTYLEAWVSINSLIRFVSFGTMPPEIGIESGGIKAVLPRNIARAAVNQLLARLGQGQIA
jgi:hypothetical protein